MRMIFNIIYSSIGLLDWKRSLEFPADLSLFNPPVKLIKLDFETFNETIYIYI